MDNQLYNSENIDAYLSGKLPAKDLELFESGLSKDPLLQNEISLQKDIIESLKNHRKAELKKRLDKIQVSSGPTFPAAKIAASILLASLIGTGIYFFTNKKENTQVTETVTETYTPQTVEKTDSEIIFSGPSQPEEKTSISKSEKQVAKKEQPEKVKSDNAVTDEQNSFESPVVKDISDHKSEIDQDRNIKMPDATIAHSHDNKFEDITVKLIKKKNHDLQYQFYNSKLFLYGDFQNETYEILELNSAKSKQLYLFFDDNYFELTPGQEEMVPLKEIKDPAILKQLDKIKD